jgi:hypothetical protein
VCGEGGLRDFYFDLPFLGLIRVAKHSSQVSLKLSLLHEEVVDEETFTQIGKVTGKNEK